MFQSRNPYTGQNLANFATHNPNEINELLQKNQQGFNTWRQLSFAQRGRILAGVKTELLAKKADFAHLITVEMGKPITQSIAEIEKCATVLDFYINNAADILKTKPLEHNDLRAKILYQPLGQILLIMPWNFPFWQVFRFAAAALMAGNTVVLKHAPNTQLCAEAIEKLFAAAFEKTIFVNIRVENQSVEQLITSDFVKGVSITGSNRAGAAVAQNAGKVLKKSVLELGGNDAALIFADADINRAVETVLWSRLQNSGQTCIATKRILVQKDIFNDFLSKSIDFIKAQTVGNPLDLNTKISCLARRDLAETANNQLTISQKMGADVVYQGSYLKHHNFFPPTLLTNVNFNSPLFNEEIFAPMAGIYTFETEQEALAIANNSIYGLGASVWTADFEKGEYVAERLEVGAVAINQLLKSDARLPFGGTKQSGFGRELGEDGIKEFVNIKTVSF